MQVFLFRARLADVPNQTESVIAALGPRFDRALVRAALSEALLNAILHGALGLDVAFAERDVDALLELTRSAEAAHDAEIEVEVDVESSEIAVVRVRDGGAGFDWRSALVRVADDIDDAATLANRGRGIPIMRAAAEVTWNERGNEVSLRFRAHGTTIEPPRMPSTPPRGSSVPPMADAGAGKVLVVDDVELNCMILAHQLKSFGFEVETATSGAYAVERMIEWQPEIVLLDLHMPDMNGIDVLSRMKQLDLFDRMPVIIMTANSEDADLRLRAIDLGAIDFLSKGVARRELVTRIRRMISIQRTVYALFGEREQLRRSIDAAGELMRSLLPAPQITCGAAVVWSLVMPSATIGGDVVDLVHLGPGRWATLLLDVAGHGLRAALTASASRALMRERLLATQSIADAAAALHRYLLLDTERTHLHVALTAVVIDENKGTLEVLNAGSPPPAVWRRDGRVELFPSRSPPAGLIDESEFEAVRLKLDDVVRVVLVSDGITEPFAKMQDTIGALAACCGSADLLKSDRLPRSEIEASVARLGDHRDDASIVWIQTGVSIPFEERSTAMTQAFVPPAVTGLLSRIGAATTRTATMVCRDAIETLSPVIRRGLDVAAGAVGLAVALPVVASAALAIKLTSPGPAFYAQTRVGQHGRPFRMRKLRTMYVDADARLASMQHLNESEGGVTFKIKRDPRITPVGRILRRLSIDELPQLWNLIDGTMTLFGPRPPLPREVAKYGPRERRRLEVKPGLTCLWQVSGRSDLSFAEQVALDITYVDTSTPKEEARILAMTIPAVLTGKGAY